MQEQKTIAELTRALIDFDTANYDDRAGGYTIELLRFVKKYLAANGVRAKIHPYELERTVDGKQAALGRRGILLSEYDPRRPCVLLQGHADTVPIAVRYGGKICRAEGGVIHGRGAVDMKGALAAMISTLIALGACNDSGYQVVLLITSDEEAGGFAGLRKFLEIEKQLKLDIRFAICGEATRFAVKQDFLGAMYLRFSFRGKSGHAAHKRAGENAIERAVPFLGELLSYQARLEQEANQLGTAVMNIGTIRGGEKVNQIPTRCTVEVSLRTTQPNRIYEEELAELAEKCGGKIEEVFSYNPVRLPDAAGFTALLRKSAGGKPNAQANGTIMKEFTEATLLNQSGIPTVVFGPGNPLLNHSDQERIATRDIARYARALEDFLRSWQASN